MINKVQIPKNRRRRKPRNRNPRVTPQVKRARLIMQRTRKLYRDKLKRIKLEMIEKHQKRQNPKDVYLRINYTTRYYPRKIILGKRANGRRTGVDGPYGQHLHLYSYLKRTARIRKRYRRHLLKLVKKKIKAWPGKKLMKFPDQMQWHRLPFFRRWRRNALTRRKDNKKYMIESMKGGYIDTGVEYYYEPNDVS